MNTMTKKTQSKILYFVFLLVILLWMVLFQINNALAENKTSNESVAPRIINGESAKSGDWPWMAAILISGSRPAFDRQFCGGTLVAPQWVLTAAHCVDDFYEMEILLGDNELNGSEGEIIPVSKIIIHPEYDSKKNNADIALIKMARPSSINPVSIANGFNFQNQRGDSAIALGWGTALQTVETNYYPSDLQQVTLTIESSVVCDSRISPLDKNIICLEVSDEKDTCSGDSGGPLLIYDQASQSWKQIGITSFGPKNCASNGLFTAYTQVDKYNHFIQSTITSRNTDSEQFLTKCVKKYTAFVGQQIRKAFPCGDNNSEFCQNTTGGSLMDIIQLAVSRDNKDEILQYYTASTKQWHEIAYADIGYCE